MTDTTKPTDTDNQTESTPAAAPSGGNNSLFEGTQSGETLSTLVGEGKKFKTAEDLAKSALEKDRFIEQLKTETAEMRAAIKESEQSGDLLKKILAKMEGGEGSTINPDNTGGEDGQDKKLDPEELVKRVTQRLKDEETHSKAVQNERDAQASLIASTGSEQAAREALAKRAGEMGLSVKKLQEIAQASPTAFLEVMGVKAEAKPKDTKNTVIHQDVKPPSDHEGDRNSAYYTSLRKTVGNTKFFTPAIQNQLFKDREALGDRW